MSDTEKSPTTENGVASSDITADSVTEATKILSVTDDHHDQEDNKSIEENGFDGSAAPKVKSNESSNNTGVAASNEEKKIFVGGISADTTNEDLLSHFSQFGAVLQAQVKYDRITGRSRGFAFVEFQEAEPCRKALSNREQTVKGKQIEVKPAKSRENKKVFVGGLPSDYAEDKLRAHFEQYGIVEDIEWPFDRQRNVRRNFAFIVFETEEGADAASVDLKQTFGDRECDVKKAVPQSRRLNPMAAAAMHAAAAMSYGPYGAGAPPFYHNAAAQHLPYGSHFPPPPPRGGTNNYFTGGNSGGRGGGGHRSGGGGYGGAGGGGGNQGGYGSQSGAGTGGTPWSSQAQAWNDWYGNNAAAAGNGQQGYGGAYGSAYGQAGQGGYGGYGYGAPSNGATGAGGAGAAGSDYWTAAVAAAAAAAQQQQQAGSGSAASNTTWGGTFDAYAAPAGAGGKGGGGAGAKGGASGAGAASAPAAAGAQYQGYQH